jgi:hypothetical protein
LIFHQSQAAMTSVCTEGLKSGAELKGESKKLDRSNAHPYIFFRAPYQSGPIDHTSIETEIASSYGKGPDFFRYHPPAQLVWIRVDPAKTYVYSSEARSGTTTDDNVNNSRKTMAEYLDSISANAKEEKEPHQGQMAVYNQRTYKIDRWVPVEDVDDEGPRDLSWPYTTTPIHTNSEVLVRLPLLSKDHFVRCGGV